MRIKILRIRRKASQPRNMSGRHALSEHILIPSKSASLPKSKGWRRTKKNIYIYISNKANYIILQATETAYENNSTKKLEKIRKTKKDCQLSLTVEGPLAIKLFLFLQSHLLLFSFSSSPCLFLFLIQIKGNARRSHSLLL